MIPATLMVMNKKNTLLKGLLLGTVLVLAVISNSVGQVRTHVLSASKSYSPIIDVPAEDTLSNPLSFAIPSEITVSKGNAGNGTVVLQFRYGNDQLATV